MCISFLKTVAYMSLLMLFLLEEFSLFQEVRKAK
jgi:hypothetical protein